MTQYNTLDVQLSNSQIKWLKSGIKIKNDQKRGPLKRSHISEI